MSLYFRNTLISFTIDAIPFQADNFSYGPIENTIPGHSHATGSYEIHYIPYGYGNLVLPDQTCQVEPNTLYVTGPQVQHAQIPLKEETDWRLACGFPVHLKKCDPAYNFVQFAL